MVLAMSEEQLKAAETEATAQAEESVEEISEEDLAGVAGGGGFTLSEFLVGVAVVSTAVDIEKKFKS